MKTISTVLTSVALTLSLTACGGTCPHTQTSLAENTLPLVEPNDAPNSLSVELPGTENGVITNESVFGGFGCSGENKSLAIRWSGAPEGTQSYAVVIHDPDAPTGVGFFHWTVTGIPSGTTELALNASQAGLPEGAVQSYTDFGMSSYGGPCPPPGAPHRYIVTVYALDVPSLGLEPNATGALVRFMLRGHTLALGRSVGTYGRSQ